MVWMAHGKPFTQRDGKGSGTDPHEVEPADVNLAFAHDWVPVEKPEEPAEEKPA